MDGFGKSVVNVSMNFTRFARFPFQENSSQLWVKRLEKDSRETSSTHVDRRSSRSYEIGTFHSLSSP